MLYSPHIPYNNGRSIEYGNSADALLTMKLVYHIYEADLEWRNKFLLNQP